MKKRKLLHACAVVVASLVGGPVSASASALGCQQIISEVLDTGRVALQGVNFDFNRATLRPDSLPALVAARDAIRTARGIWTVEGHTDNVGSHGYNLQLSLQRAQAVADWLLAAGIPASQLRADGFSFDRPVASNDTAEGRALNRRVELTAADINRMELGFGGPADVEPEGCGETAPAEVADAPDVPDWSGAGGQEWLPFSEFSATAMGGGTGWEGVSIDMAPGSRPEACRALCLAEDRCGAYGFQPAGSYFIEHPRCNMIGYGSEMTLTRSNSYGDDGTFFATGLKPDARLLTPASEAVAQAILADMREVDGYRAQVRIEAPAEVVTGQELAFRIVGAVPAERHESVVEIAVLGDHTFNWSNIKTARFRPELAGDGSGLIDTPEPGDYTLRYVIRHATFGQHVVAEQALKVLPEGSSPSAPAAPAPSPGTQDEPEPDTRRSSVEPGIDRPGHDISQTPLSGNDPLMCRALCAEDASCRAWTFVRPGVQGDQAVCWTKFDVPEGYENDCCTSGVMAEDAAFHQPAPYETEGMGEDTGYYCPTDALPCQFEDKNTRIAFTVAPGFYADLPVIYETAGGAAADEPSFSLFRISDNALAATLNERQWSADLGPCFDNMLGRLCLYAPGGHDTVPADAQMAFGVFAASLRRLEA